MVRNAVMLLGQGVLSSFPMAALGALVVYAALRLIDVPGFKRLARFSPYVAGTTFTQADCAAWVSLPLISMATRAVYGDDLLVAGGVDWKPYSKLISERASAQRITADRKADQERSAAKP